jgi:hypothetical protein
MAIRAQKIALARLRPDGVERTRQAALTQPEPLHLGVSMVELERSDAPVVATYDAAPACFHDEELLYAPAAGRNCDDAASAAAVRPITIDYELREAVCLAIAIEFHPARLPARTGLSDCIRRARAEVPPSQPVADGRLRAAEAVRDLALRQTLPDQLRKRFTAQPAPSRMLLRVHGCQPMLLHPVADRRFVEAESPADLRKGQSFREKCCQRIPIHAEIIPSSPDGKSERLFRCRS